MPSPAVTTFFYGSYMNPAVLAEVDLRPASFEVATLTGFDITVRPLANLVPSAGSVVYGVLAAATHAELRRLYEHAEHVLGGIYKPQAVLCQTAAGRVVPALCHIAHEMKDAPATADYIERIAAAARTHKFPAWYIERIESFAPREKLSAIGFRPGRVKGRESRDEGQFASSTKFLSSGFQL